MTCETITTGVVPEDSAFTLLARIRIDGITTGVQTAVSSITWDAYSVDDLNTAVTSGTLTVGDVTYDTLQTDGRWTEDTTGYNFRHDISNAVFTTPGRYRIQHQITTTSGRVFNLNPPFIVTVVDYAGT